MVAPELFSSSDNYEKSRVEFFLSLHLRASFQNSKISKHLGKMKPSVIFSLLLLYHHVLRVKSQFFDFCRPIYNDSHNKMSTHLRPKNFNIRSNQRAVTDSDNHFWTKSINKRCKCCENKPPDVSLRLQVKTGVI